MILLQKLPTQTNQIQGQLNLQTITVWVTDDTYIIEPNHNKSLIHTILKVDRHKHTIIELTNYQKNKQGKPHYFSLLVGIVNINGIKVIILVQQVNLVCQIGNRDIFKIVKPIYLFFNQKDKEKVTEEEARIMVNLTTILEQGMFFSFSYDLTLLLNNSLIDNNRRQQFNWAIHLQKDFSTFAQKWRVPLIQGFVGKLSIHLQGQKFQLTLISRRSVKRSGAQSYGRGIDQEGNVGNFVQSQQIISIDQYLFSFVQIRGSVPIFWQQEQTYGGMFKNIIISKNQQKSLQAYSKHLTSIFQNFGYQEIAILNLLCERNHQKKLIQNYEYMIKRTHRPDIKYLYFDIHSECREKEYSKLNLFLQNRIQGLIQKFQFTAIRLISPKEFKTLNLQKGVFRTNCLDCIDRSNIVQLRIATLSMIMSLKSLGIQKFCTNLKFLSEIDNPFVSLYRHLWADNADYLSQQYIGTGSTQSFLLRKGKLSYLTSIDHGITSISRAIRNMGDQNYYKNKTIQIMLGKIEK